MGRIGPWAPYLPNSKCQVNSVKEYSKAIVFDNSSHEFNISHRMPSGTQNYWTR
jgi:hypothetical protein